LPATSVFSYADIPDHIFQIANAAPWHRLLRHAFVKELDLRFQESVPVIDDAFFILLLQLRAARIATVPERLVYYRMHNAHAQTSRISEYPDSAYRACFAVKQELQRIGLYPQVKQSFVNFAAKMLRWYLNSVKNWKTYEYLFTQYKTRYLQDLDITGHARSYFYFGGFCYDWCTDVLQKDAADVIFQYYCGFRAGADVINYAFPRGLIPDGSRLALYGAGQMGRSYRAQIPWLNQVALVAWVDQNYERLGPEVSDPASLQSVAFDAILIAIERVSTVQEVMASLSALGIPAGKMYHTNMRREDGK
jgi:hypothetical protein